MNFDPDTVAAELSKRGQAWASADSQYRAFDESTKSILSKIAGEVEGSEAAKDRYARGSDEYQDHLQRLGDSRLKALAAKVNYDVYRVWIDMKRSELSYNKAEMLIR